MNWVKKYLSDAEAKQIEEAISRAEEETSAEIVPVIVRRSSSVGHIPLVLTLLITLVIVIGEVPFSDWLWVAPWMWLWPLLLVFIYFVAQILGKIPWIQKHLISERDEVEQVHQRAQLEFYTNKVNRTQNGTGVLIFVSVMEKKAVILADEKIANLMPRDIWDQVLAEFRINLGQGRWSQGFLHAIESCGQHLKTHFPIESRTHNDLKNHLVIKD